MKLVPYLIFLAPCSLSLVSYLLFLIVAVRSNQPVPLGPRGHELQGHGCQGGEERPPGHGKQRGKQPTGGRFAQGMQCLGKQLGLRLLAMVAEWQLSGGHGQDLGRMCQLLACIQCLQAITGTDEGIPALLV